MSISPLVKSFFLWVQLIFQTKLRSNELGLICPGGIGDTYFTCALAKEISQANQDLSIVVIVKQNHSDIPDLFPDSITRKVTCRSRQIVNLASFTKNLIGGRLFFAHPSIRFRSKICQISMMGFKNLHLLDMYKFTFQLDCATELSLPQVPHNAITIARKRIIDYGLPLGKTVVLAPDFNSTPGINSINIDDFWSNLAHRLITQGYTVVLMTNKDQDFLPQIPRVNFPLIEAIPFVEMCGWVIASRSGFCDLIATAKSKLTIIYPEQSLYSGTVYSCYGLRLMETSTSANEIVVSKSCQINEVIDQIMSNDYINNQVCNY